MTELKLSELKGLLPKQRTECPHTNVSPKRLCMECIAHNDLVYDLSAENLLDYVEAVVCLMCDGTGSVIRTSDSVHICLSCMGNGAVIRVKEGRTA